MADAWDLAMLKGKRHLVEKHGDPVTLLQNMCVCVFFCTTVCEFG